MEKTYTSKEVSNYLDIGTSTLRKWCLSLEANDYFFSRTDTNRRFFLERDLVTLKYFKRLVQDESFSLDNASKIIASRNKEDASLSKTNSDTLPSNRSNDIIDELRGHIEKQNDFIENQDKFNKELIERLDKQNEYIERRLKERDEKLMLTLRESTKKGFLARLFGK